MRTDAVQPPPPFKPFTLTEVDAICHLARPCEGGRRLMARWAGMLPPCMGDDRKTVGLDWMQAFAVYVGRRFWEEGAGIDRADAVVRHVAGMKVEALLFDLKEGRTWPTQLPSATGGTIYLMTPPPPGRAGQELNLKKLHAQFCDARDRHFKETR